MYLTRFQINPHRRDAAKLLASPQVMHAAVLAGFPNEIRSDAGRVLWRVDRAGVKHLLIISSPTKPDLTHLVEQAGWPAVEGGWETRDFRPLLDRFDGGQQWGFRLTGNPTHALAPQPGERRGRIVAHRTVEHQIGWLAAQSNRHGFSLVEQQIQRLDAESGQPRLITASTARLSRSEIVRFARGGQTVTLRVAEFDGLLEITDPDRFRGALSHGIGSARAYGCGLLTVAPVAGIEAAQDS
ncbi:MAG: type I-E CRISPR-associated protein Cas6/Cse3/CasE [Actinobacteria bacterium]|nr:type I-E CRISPR-associated protein Cas6/Cse3/CasE [Actinomycetota bacterium]